MIKIIDNNNETRTKKIIYESDNEIANQYWLSLNTGDQFTLNSKTYIIGNKTYDVIKHELTITILVT